MRIGPQLLTYPDSLGGDLAAIRALLDGPLAGLFGGIHVLPPFPSSADRGFAPRDLPRDRPALRHAGRTSARSPRTTTCCWTSWSTTSPARATSSATSSSHGRRSRWADLFITLDKVWPDGQPPAEDVARIFLRKPDHPFSTITIADSGEQETIWTSFGTADWSEQVDLDLRAPATRALITDWLAFFASQGVRIVRLDAVGYVVKKAGTSCFMVEPEIWEVMDWLVGVADGLGLTVLPEVHDVYATHEKLTAHGYWTYDFVLPGLVLHAFETGEATRLREHLARSPERQFTTLDCHDGIPVRPDLDGILEPGEMLRLADAVLARGGNVNRILSDSHAEGSRRPPAQLHLLLGPRRGRRPLRRGASHPALRAGRPAGLLRGAARRRQRPRGGRSGPARVAPSTATTTRSRRSVRRSSGRSCVASLSSSGSARPIRPLAGD